VISNKLVSNSKQIQNQDHRDFENYRDIVWLLVQKDLKVRYNNKFLGYLWSIANPLASALIYYFAFEVIMRAGVPDYPLVLIAGLFPWQWFSNAVGAAPTLFVGSSWLIKKVNFPRNFIPLCSVINHMIHFVISIPIIVLLLFFYRESINFSTWIYGLPILVLLQFVTTYSISLILASLNLFFRDLERLTGIVINFLFFLTPILYPFETMAHRFGPKAPYLVMFNPAAPLILNWRTLFLKGTIDGTYLLMSLVYAIVLLAIAHLIYKKLSWRFAEVI